MADKLISHDKAQRLAKGVYDKSVAAAKQYTDESLEIEVTDGIDPVGSNTKIWIDTAGDLSTSVVARINDDATAAGTTWSSNKIAKMLDDSFDLIETSMLDSILDSIFNDEAN